MPHAQVGAHGRPPGRTADPVASGGRGSDGGARRGRRRSESEAARARREQREAQRAAQRRALRLRLTLVVSVVAVLGVASVAVYQSQLFAIETVEVTGTEMLSPEAVTAQVGLPADATLLRFPRSAIESRLTSDPWIAEVSIKGRLPSTLSIGIVERTPAALIDTGTTFWFVDADGRFLGESSLESTGSVLPVIRDVPETELVVAGEVTANPALRNALDVLSGLSEDLAVMVRAVSAASAHETTLITQTGVEIMVGEAVQLPEKSALALGIMAEQGTDVVFIDVRSIDRPISRGLGR